MVEPQVAPQVEELPDGRLVAEGFGLTAEQARIALEFFRSEWGELVGETSQEMRRHLMARLLQSGSDIVEPASLAQARRQASLKASLLESSVYTYETLSEVRGDPSVNATQTAVSRARQRGRVFTVTYEGRTLLPAFQFEADGSPRADLAPLLEPLLAAQLGAWQLWTWLTRPAALLGGLVPEQAAADPETADRAARAAQRLAARVPSASEVAAATQQAVADVVAEGGNRISLPRAAPGFAISVSADSPAKVERPDRNLRWETQGDDLPQAQAGSPPENEREAEQAAERGAEQGAERGAERSAERGRN